MKNILILIFVTSTCIACEQTSPPATEASQTVAEIQNDLTYPADSANKQNPAAKIENKHYLYDVTEHSVEELQALLERISMIMDASPEAFDNLNIVMILHGPDIGLFTRQNYEKNKIVVDLARKLDSIEVVDMQACETTMKSLGYTPDQLPEFIETVPYAPDAMNALNKQGYINL